MTPQPLREGNQIAETDAPAAADHRPLVRQHRVRGAPPATRRAQAHRVGNADVGEEDLVEVRGAVDLPQRPHVDARRAHVDEERGDALVLRRVGVAAGEQQAPVAVVRARRPHLLAVDSPLLAVELGACAQSGEVGARARFGEELAPHVVAAQHRGQEALLLFGRTPRDDRRAGHRDTDREHTGRDVVVRLLLVEDPRLPARTASSAGFDRPRDPGPTAVEHDALPFLARGDVLVVGIRVAVAGHVRVVRLLPRLTPLGMRVEPGAHLDAERLLFFGFFEIHSQPPMTEP